MKNVNLHRWQIQRICFVLLLFFFISYTYANVETVTIGTGTTTCKYLPMYPYYGYSYSQSVYTQSEINVSNSYISSISYHFVNINGENSSFTDDVKIYMGHTTKSAFTSSSDYVSVTDMVLVYDGTFTISERDEWVTIYLDTPFLYNNENNLVVAFDENTSGYHDSQDGFYCNETSTNSSIYYYNDNTNSDPSNPQNGSLSVFRPDLKFNFDTYTCEAVKDIVVTKTSDTEINVSWNLQDDEQTAWIIEYGEHGFTPGEGTQVTATTNSGTTISDLPNGLYDLYVTTDCGNNDYSGYLSNAAFYIFDLEGEGTETSPYEITSLSDLSLLSKITDFWSYAFILTSDIDASETQTSDIYNNEGTGFSPIGNSNVRFTGSFDGNNHVISNLYINTASEYSGLFGNVGAGATIENLGLENPNMTSTAYYSYTGVLIGEAYGSYYKNVSIRNCYIAGGSVNARNFTGALIGSVSYTSISNCYTATEVNTSAYYVGGFIGYIQYSSQFENCYSSGLVSGTSNVGAFVGYNSAGSFTDCYFDKETSNMAYGGSDKDYSGLTGLETSEFMTADNFINWDFDAISGDWQTGAIANDSYYRPRLIWQTVEADVCLTPVSVVVTATNNTSAHIDWIETGSATEWTVEYGEHGFNQGEGTIVAVSGTEGAEISGLSYPEVYDIYVSSSCGSTSKPVVYVNFKSAGSGTDQDPYKISNLADLNLLSKTNEVWSANFILTADIDATETEINETYNNAGLGFTPIGNNTINFTGTFDGDNHIISNLYFNTNCSNIGLFGYIGAGAKIENIGIEDASVTSLYDTYIGSLCGRINGTSELPATVTNCYSIGGIVEGSQIVGGFCGFSAYATFTNCYSTNKTIANGYYAGGFTSYISNSTQFINCYSSGSVSGTSYVGAFTGYNYDATFTDCYFDNESSSFDKGGYGEDYSGLTGVSSVEFALQDKFENWNFNAGDGVWQIGALENDPYYRPRLMWQSINENVCLAPLEISVTAIDNMSINISWTEPGSSTSWTIEYGEHGFTQGEGDVVSVSGATSAIIAGLSYPKVYDIYLASACGSVSGRIKYTNFSEVGSGTADDPYKISNLDDLDLLSKHSYLWDNYFMMTANIDASETATSDIYNNGYGFNPIGDDNIHFAGSFDGNGFVISNIYIHSSSDNIGLFGYVGEGAVLKNIGLYAPMIEPYYSNTNFVGSLAGYVEGGSDNKVRIDNCYSISGEVSGYQYVGGMLGRVFYTNISDCYVNNKVSADYKYVGGFAGNSNYDAVFENCYSAGSVTGSSYIGGFSGSFNSYASFTNCFFDKETSRQSYAANSVNVDGITGLITSDFATGEAFTNWDFTDTWVVSKIFNEDVLRPRFHSQMRTLTIAVSGNGTTSPSAGIYNFTLGEPIEVVATAFENNEFLLWREDNDDYSTEISYAVSSLDNDVIIEANFTGGTTGIVDNQNVDITIFPNPAINFVFVKGEGIVDETIQIISISGSIMLSKFAGSNVEQLDISSLSAGTYFVVLIKNNNTVFRQKLVKL